MSELKNGFLTAEEVMDILQIKQSKAYLTHGNILATVHQKSNGNNVIEIKTRHIVSETLINSVKFLRDGAEFEQRTKLRKSQ